MDKIHSGYLTKSPPERKSLSSKFFRSKWRRRYFVIYAPPTSETALGMCSAVLYYYDNEKMTRRIGSIDLDHCDEILSNLTTLAHKHVFSISTQDRGKTRKYYLASDTEEDMTRWVDCLCRLLRLEDRPLQQSRPSGVSLDRTHTERTPHPPRVRPPIRAISHQHIIDRYAPEPSITQSSESGSPSNISLTSTSASLLQPGRDVRDEYINLSDCFSDPVERNSTKVKVIRITSKTESVRQSGQRELNARHPVNVVRVTPIDSYRSDLESEYDLPKRGYYQEDHSTAVSSPQASVSSDDIYHFPKPLYPIQDEEDQRDSVRNVHGSHDNLLYNRSPISHVELKPKAHEAEYSFPSSNEPVKSAAKHDLNIQDTGTSGSNSPTYDFLPPARPVAALRSTPKDIQGHRLPPSPGSDSVDSTPPRPHTKKVHRYVNAQAGVVVESPPKSQPAACSSPSYINTDDVCSSPVNNRLEDSHSDSGMLDGSFVAASSVSWEDESIYNTTVSNRSLERNIDPKSVDFQDSAFTNEVFHPVQQTSRTRSFKRSVTQGDNIRLPIKNPRSLDESSSEEDESDNSRSDSPSAIKQPMGNNVVQYLDLQLGTTSISSNSESRPAVSVTTATDYNDIDWIKTNALNETRKERENKRKSSDK